jgi:2-oxoglutarate dehydrogenase E2 component (dihydrolipoamide succinyltransferase)
VKAIKDFPMINAFATEDYIVKKKAIHIGLAVALPGGNLIVPVIKHVDQLSLAELAQKVQAIVHKARHQQLVPDELAEATYTVSNLGSFHNLMGTPIIPQPQVAILALGEIVKKPAVIESDQGDIIAIRHRMYLSHSYDHKVADYLESFVGWVCW